MDAPTLDLFPMSPVAFPSSPQWTGPELPQAPPLFRTYSGSQLCKFETPAAIAPGRHEWLDAVGKATAGFRKYRADKLLQRAAELAGLAPIRRTGVTVLTSEGWAVCPIIHDPRDMQWWESRNPVSYRHNDNRWHLNRAKALREKVSRVKKCRTDAVIQQCNDCGTFRETPITCGDAQLCLHCRTARVTKYVKRFEPAHVAADKAIAAAGYKLPYGRHGGRWSAKFVTVTITHSGDLAADLAAFPRAWPKFLQRIRRHYLLDRGLTRQMVDALVYVRVLEITPGGHDDDDDPELAEAKGHAHMHLYMFGPFIHQALLAHYWGQSLDGVHRTLCRTVDRAGLLADQDDPRKRKELEALLVTRRGQHGRPLSKVFRPIVDIRQCTGSPHDIASEFAKYLIKDGQRSKQTGELEYVDPEWFAHAYRAMYERRSIAACRHFWIVEYAEPQNVRCDDCGGWHIKTYFAALELARGPPDTNMSDT